MNKFFCHESAFIDQGCIIGDGSKIWHFSHIMPGAILGQNCILGQNVFVAGGVVIGDRVKVQNNVSIYEGVQIEDDVFLGPSCVFTNVINPRGFVERKTEYKKTLIKKGASVGANATIICGNTLGMYCFIGAGTVVTKEVKDYALVVGNPGRQVGWVSAYGHQLLFDEHQMATCPQSGVRYFLEENEVKIFNEVK